MKVIDLRGTMAMKIVALINGADLARARLVSEEDFTLEAEVAGPAVVARLLDGSVRVRAGSSPGERAFEDVPAESGARA